MNLMEKPEVNYFPQQPQPVVIEVRQVPVQCQQVMDWNGNWVQICN